MSNVVSFDLTGLVALVTEFSREIQTVGLFTETGESLLMITY